MGNDALYALTNQGDYSMQIDMKSCNGNYYYVKWRLFRIDNEAANYAITDIIVDSYNTSTNYWLEEVLGWRFGTIDNPVWRYSDSCPEIHGGGWWFKDCTRWHLTGYMSCNIGHPGMKFVAITGVSCDVGCRLEAGTMKIRRNI
ncbi:fibrinogen-like protein A [Lingula anatina]|uniref:Fibrinogen-like protein A n=1 Tax=Lingula anatina TaxID=7574 RepID=A0A2R2MKX6_LINAN|nr:fibrinogen-like protein A [Lingula anatina]|eukprot:XP_023930876.1 fibrinogen-like protein A [Lingula anatina]